MTVFSNAKLNVELEASNTLWLVPSAGRQVCIRSSPCCNFSGVARAAALTAWHTRAAQSVPARRKPNLLDAAVLHMSASAESQQHVLYVRGNVV